MKLSAVYCVAVVAVLLAGCKYPPPGPLVYGRCGMDAHTEAYPHAQNPERAYGCKSDDNGFLEGSYQADKPLN